MCKLCPQTVASRLGVNFPLFGLLSVFLLVNDGNVYLSLTGFRWNEVHSGHRGSILNVTPGD